MILNGLHFFCLLLKNLYLFLLSLSSFFLYLQNLKKYNYGIELWNHWLDQYWKDDNI